MRVVGVVIAALMTLGLAAFGIVAAQKAAGPSSLIALAAHVVSPSQNSAPPTARLPRHHYQHAAIPTGSVSRASSRSTPPADPHSEPSTSSNTISCATRKSC